MGATPFTLRCPRCKKYRQWDYKRSGYDELSNRDLVPTGKTKIIRTTSAGVHDVQAVQMKHDGKARAGGEHCGYVFWSTHPDAVRKAFPKAKLINHGNASCRYVSVEKP